MKNPLNKEKIVSEIYDTLDGKYSVAEINSVIDEYIQSWQSMLRQGEEIKIKNFGSFKLKKSKPRKFVNIASGEAQQSSGRNLLKISLSKRLKRKIIKSIDIFKSFL